ncbi:FAD/NAD(P)-binding domain-containing protein [Thozetella sp. PMI_491]|nr:FAD/NAD(P)-binding domain-containing protein [Thozetella sp. PMI_491]
MLATLIGALEPQWWWEYPPRADLRRDVYKPIPNIPPDAIGAGGVDSATASNHALATVKHLSEALKGAAAENFSDAFFAEQAFWRDLLALTYHFRTFSNGAGIAAPFLELAKLRGVTELALVKDSVAFNPFLKTIQFAVSFKTLSPAASCSGRISLLPQAQAEKGGQYDWKIWTLSTWLENFDAFPEATDGLEVPGRDLTGPEDIETDVFIIGGGNAGIITAARLKALGVESLVVDKNPKVGDNWALRYDCLRFHVHKKCCDTPYLFYPEDVPQLPNRVHLSEHMQRYAAAFKLNMLNSTTIKWTSYDPLRKRWRVKLDTPSGEKNVVSKIFVQATGIGSSKPYIPDIPDKHLYKGINLHSTQFKNGKDLVGIGARSVIVVGSANTAFDVLEDCHNAGLKATIVARSPTFVFPWEYCLDPQGLGLYEIFPVDIVDNRQLTMPNSVAGQLAKRGMAFAASKEPNRYAPLAKAGFPVYDCMDPRADLSHHLLERAGGHYNDIGDGIKFIVEGKVDVKGSVQPTHYTALGLRFSDGSLVDADAIIWSTGYADRNTRDVAAEILGGTSTNSHNGNHSAADGSVLDPHDIAARLDATWGVDAEGEIRGMWKRHLRMENMWTVGGTATLQRFYSRFTALQIKAALEGILPEAYRADPVAKA